MLQSIYQKIFNKNKNQKNKAFTLIEILIYTAIFSVVAAGIMGVTWNITRIHDTQIAKVEVDENIRYVTNLINSKVRESIIIEEATGTTLILKMPDSTKSPVKFSLNEGIIYMQVGNENPVAITTDKVQVSNLSFERIAVAGTKGGVKVNMTIAYRATDTKTAFSRDYLTTVTKVNAITSSEHLRIASADNVGSRTNSPSYKINVSKDVGFTAGTLQQETVPRTRINGFTGDTAPNGSDSKLNADLSDGYDSSYFQTVLLNPITGIGTAGYLPKFTGKSTIGNSPVYTDGTNIGIGTTTPSQELDLIGDLELENTTSNDTGVIYKGGDRFIHNFQHPTGDTAKPAGYNTFVGVNAGNFTMGSTATQPNEGSYNSAMGSFALSSNTTGYENSAMGYSALKSNTTGFDNSAIGSSALYSNTTGYHNSAIGYSALYSNTEGSNNSAMGSFALYSNTAGYRNSAMGYYVLSSNTTGSNNSAMGYYALSSNTEGFNNSAMGHNALYYNTTGSSNSAMGSFALFSNTIGYYNIGIGYNAGKNITTGSNNIIIGSNINAPSATGNYQLNIGNTIYGDLGNDKIAIGTETLNRKFYVNGDAGGTTPWYNDSDTRLKTNVQTISNALEKVEKMRGVSFTWIDTENHPKGQHIGFIAQELKEVLPEVVDKKGEYYSVQESSITAVLVEAIKEQQKQIEDLKAQIKTLKHQ